VTTIGGKVVFTGGFGLFGWADSSAAVDGQAGRYKPCPVRMIVDPPRQLLRWISATLTPVARPN
jgi:hypothetical protein